MDYDVIVVGSGISGLACSGLLSVMGKKVLLLEGYTAGGCMHSIYLKDEEEDLSWRWNFGLQFLYGYKKKSINALILDLITRNNITLNKLDTKFQYIRMPNCDVTPTKDATGPDYDFAVYTDEKDMKNALFTAFPEEKDKIEQYFTYVYELYKRIPALLMPKLFKVDKAKKIYPKIVKNLFSKDFNSLELSVKDVIEGKIGIKNKALLTILYAFWENLGLPLDQSPFLFFATGLAINEQYSYYPVGGAPAIIDETIKTIKSNGGDFRDKSKVTEFLIKDGKAYGVKLENGEIIKAGKVISTIGIKESINLISDENKNSQVKEIVETVKKLKSVPSVIMLRVGIKGDISDCGIKLARYRTIYGKAYNMEKDPTKEGWTPEDVQVHFPSYYDTKQLTGPTHTIEVEALTKYEYFKDYDVNSPEYQAVVDRISETFITELLKWFPKLEGHIAKTMLTTPLSVEQSTGHSKGTIYGLDIHKAEHMNLQPRSGIENLYYSGEDVFAGGLIMTNGLLTSLVVLEDDFKKPIEFLKEMEKLFSESAKLFVSSELHEFIKLFRKTKLNSSLKCNFFVSI